MMQENFLEKSCKNRLTHLLRHEKVALQHGNKTLKKLKL
jgi:hypothetical protein